MRSLALLLALLLPVELAACNPADQPPPSKLRDRDYECQRPGPNDSHEDQVLCEENAGHHHVRWWTSH